MISQALFTLSRAIVKGDPTANQSHIASLLARIERANIPPCVPTQVMALAEQGHELSLNTLKEIIAEADRHVYR